MLFGGPRRADGAGRREDPGAVGTPTGAWENTITNHDISATLVLPPI